MSRIIADFLFDWWALGGEELPEKNKQDLVKKSFPSTKQNQSSQMEFEYCVFLVNRLLNEIAVNCRFGLKNMQKQLNFMAYSLNVSTKHSETIVFTTLRILLADEIKNPSLPKHLDGSFLNSGHFQEWPVPEYNVEIPQSFHTWYRVGQHCQDVGSSDVLLIGSLAESFEQLHFAVVQKFDRLGRHTPWSRDHGRRSM
ncbi:hypothetical protein GEMRC1_001681 [Eukaryota sp. GEM-RC1]